MATITHVTLVDSIDGKSTEDVETVTFFHPMTGQKMEIELNAANRKAMGTHLERMNKYFDAAVPVEVPVVKASKPAANGENAKLRAWAKLNGFEIGERGRISQEIRTAYAAATEKLTEPAEKVEEPVSENPATEKVETSTEKNAEPVSQDDVLTMLAQMDTEGAELTEEALKAALAESASK